MKQIRRDLVPPELLDSFPVRISNGSGVPPIILRWIGIACSGAEQYLMRNFHVKEKVQPCERKGLVRLKSRYPGILSGLSESEGRSDLEADEPAEEEVVVQLLHEEPLTPDRVEDLELEGPEELLRGDGGAARVRVQLGELRRQPLEDRLGHGPDGPEGVVPGHSPLRGEVAEHRRLLVVRPSHAAPPHTEGFEAHHTRSAWIGKRENSSVSASC